MLLFEQIQRIESCLPQVTERIELLCQSIKELGTDEAFCGLIEEADGLCVDVNDAIPKCSRRAGTEDESLKKLLKNVVQQVFDEFSARF